MPRPKTGNAPWKALAVKLPPDELAEVQRYSDVYGVSISDLLREGLRLRMHPPQGQEPAGPPAFSARLTRLLTEALAELHRNGQAPRDSYKDNGNTPTATISNTVIPHTKPARKERANTLGRDQKKVYGGLKVRVLEALRAHPHAMANEIAVAVYGVKTDRAIQAVTQSLRALVEQGLAVREAKTYRLAEPPMA